MNRVVKFALLPSMAIIAVVGAIAVYVAATFDPNQYKSQIEEAVRAQTGRTIRLEGDIKLSLFPGLGVTLGKVWLSERASDREFAGIEDIRIEMKLRPLLSKRIEIDTIEIRNLHANVVRTPDGKINIQDLTGGGADNQRAPPSIDINHLVLRNATITCIDQLLNARYVLRELDLATGHLANGIASAIDLSFVLQSEKPKLDLATKLTTTLTFDLSKRHYALKGLNLTATGLAAEVSDLEVIAQGNVEASLERQELFISTLSFAGMGKREGGDLTVKLELPKLYWTPERANSEGITLDATSSTRTTKIAATLAVPALNGIGQVFEAREAAASFDWHHAGASVKGRATSPLTADVNTRKFELSKLMLNISVVNAKLLKNPLDAAINATVKADFGQQTAAAAFTTRIDGSSVNGRAVLKDFAAPFYTFDINVDQLNADSYLPTQDPKQPDEPFDLSTLKTLNVSGSLRIGEFTMAGIKASNVHLEVKPDSGLDGRVPAASPHAGADRSGIVTRKPRRALPAAVK